MSRIVRCALTQTVNQYSNMPAQVDDVGQLAGKMDDIRRANVAFHIGLAEQAKAQGVHAICFGEVFPGPYFAITQDPVWLDLAEPLDGRTVTELRAVAKRLDMVIVAPIYELDPNSGERFNTAVVIDADGEVAGFYSKTHIPEGKNERGVFTEKFYFQRSSGRAHNFRGKNISNNPFFPVFSTKVGKVGVAICYDRHFEGVTSSLQGEGAEIVFIPAVTFGDKSQRMWHHEFATDACRLRIFIGGSNRKGQEPPWNQPFFGESHFVGPDGVLPNLAAQDELIIADLDLDTLTGRDPSGWTLLEDRRPQIYGRRTGRQEERHPAFQDKPRP